MAQQDCDDYPPIADYAIIGDCHTAALVSSHGSIDWYCPERFDAPAVFCRLLDARRGGYFRIAPPGPSSANRSYRADTNVLDTTFTAATGQVRLTDLMPVFHRQAGRRGYDVGSGRSILRLVECTAGEVELEVAFKPTFDYARAAPAELSTVPGGLVAGSGSQRLVLVAPDLDFAADRDGAAHARLRLHAGERRWLALSQDTGADAEAGASVRSGQEYDRWLRSTLDYWEKWSASCRYRGPYRRAVVRSALALKLLTYEPTGAVIAAPTTSLPEQIGGVRNWDYRYSWLRDSALILYALMTIGFDDEAGDFFEWLSQAEHSDPKPDRQIMYTIDGGRDMPEVHLDHLSGYRCSRPVRIGNGAARQTQLDIYGEVLTAAYVYFRGAPAIEIERGVQLPEQRLTAENWSVLRPLVEQAARRWQEPDSGIWEVRGGPQRFLYSRLMCWAAVDRGLRLAEHYHLPAPFEEWRSVRDAIRHAILTEGYDERQGAFTQAFGSTALDASALYIPLAGFLAPSDARVRSTVARIQRELSRGGLVDRYRAEDGLPGSEGTFTLCSLWLVDNLALSGKLDEAHALFERVAGYANNVGLLSEEIDVSTGHLLGNFPQGFTHMALIGSAVNLAKGAKHGPEEHPQNEAERTHRARSAVAPG